MYAIIQDGGHQYKVEPGQTVRVQRKSVEPGAAITFDKVVAIGGESTRIGTPYVAAATVTGTVLRESKGEKVISFIYRRRKDSERKVGHRQKYTDIRIDAING